MYVCAPCVSVSLSVQTKQWVADMKMNGEVRGVAFTPDARQLLSYGSEPQFTILFILQYSTECFTGIS